MSESLFIGCVDRARRIVDIKTTTQAGTEHRVGHLPGEGWFCLCARGKSCKQINHVKQLVPEMEQTNEP